MLQDIKLQVGILGERIGLGLIVAVTIWDIAFSGLRGFMEYSIGWKGIVCIWVGLVLIYFRKKIDKELR